MLPPEVVKAANAAMALTGAAARTRAWTVRRAVCLATSA
jgi:hypothetical protein